MVRQLKLKDQGPYVKRLNVLGKSFAFNPQTGCTLSDHPNMDKYAEALLSIPGVELVQGGGQAPQPQAPPQPQPKPQPSPSGPQPAAVKVEEAKPQGMAEGENKNSQ